MPTEFARVVALGASNLTLGFQSVVSMARAAWGPDVEILAALGLGRSYGACSRVLVRTLPGILESGLWKKLESLAEVRTRGLVTDVGNDILYGSSAGQALAWVEEAVRRLLRVTRVMRDIILTDLPLASIRRLSSAKFLVFRSILFPSCRLSLAQVLESVERVNAGLAELSTTQGIRFFIQNPAWYGFDPIHIRPELCRQPWKEILDAHSTPSGDNSPWLDGIRLYFMPPERQWLLGLEQFSPQSGVSLSSGARVWLY